MRRSIRKFLLLYLLMAMVLTTLATAIGNYYLDRRDIEKEMDLLLKQASVTLQMLLGTDFHSRDLKKLQARLDTLPRTQYQFQIIKDPHDKKPLLRSPFSPKTTLPYSKEGFADIVINNQHWRTYTRYDPELKITLTLAETDSRRIKLFHALIIDDITIMLLAYPIAGLLIWFIIGRALRSIARVTEEVAHRLPNYLDPVDPESVPVEIEALVVELNHLFQRLQKAFEREKRFAGDAAHELRTPLAALKTQAQVAKKTTDETERKRQLQNVIVAVDRCTHVVQQLLILSRLAPETDIITDTTRVDLSKLAAEVIAQLAPIALKKKIDIELIPDSSKKAFVRGNITALSILIRNLVDNAIRYTPEKGEVAIKVSVDSRDKKVLLTVTDNGPGIPPELRTRVFERFFRILGSKSPGSGLGLAITQRIATLHNATLTLALPPSGKGLEVMVSFNQPSSRPRNRA